MKPETLEALDQSIAHWEDIANLKCFDIGSDACALCTRFNVDGRTASCSLGDEKCPVFEATGSVLCGDSPYNAVSKYKYRILNVADDSVLWINKNRSAQFVIDFQEAATRELKFLKSLRIHLQCLMFSTVLSRIVLTTSKKCGKMVSGAIAQTIEEYICINYYLPVP